jgi:D-sedoheptulose 7-phosphate isomerase
MSLRANLDTAVQIFQGLAEKRELLAEVAEALRHCLANGHKLLTCGNGGSAAEAQHFATELIGRYRSNRRSLPALFLGGDTSLLTCIGNDFDWTETFARPLQGLAQPGDIVVGLSTSGNSQNVVRALEVSKTLGLQSVALLGKDGGKAAGLATWEIIVPSHDTARIQEAHLFIIHYFCDEFERGYE